MVKDRKDVDEKETQGEKPAENLEQLEDQIEKQAQALVKQTSGQQGQTVIQETPRQDQPAAPPDARKIQVDESSAKTSYSNFCYTAGTREGVLCGFGFHDWQPGNPIKVDAKIEMSYFNARRLLATLNQVVKRHETAFGEIEIDVNKRIKKNTPV